jgi:hypothetical protein
VNASLCLPCLSFDGIAQSARREQFGFLAQALRFVGKSFFKGLSVSETASPHGRCSIPSEEGGSATMRSRHR